MTFFSRSATCTFAPLSPLGSSALYGPAIASWVPELLKVFFHVVPHFFLLPSAGCEVPPPRDYPFFQDKWVSRESPARRTSPVRYDPPRLNGAFFSLVATDVGTPFPSPLYLPAMVFLYPGLFHSPWSELPHR